MIDKWILANAADLQVVVFFTLFAVFAAIEWLHPTRPEPMDRRGRWLTNALLTGLNITVLSLLPVTFLGVAVWAQQHSVGVLNLMGAPLAFLLLANLLGRGLISFLTHFLMHKVPILWRVHRVHHLDTELDVSTTVRFHPIEFVIGLLIGAPMILLLGLSPWMLLLYEILDAGVTLFSHANVRLPVPVDRVLRYLIVTPDLHRVHHSSYQPETDSNFSAVFPIWDVVFGTFRTETRQPQETMELGLEDVRDGRENRFWWLLLSPLKSLRDSPEASKGE